MRLWLRGLVAAALAIAAATVGTGTAVERTGHVYDLADSSVQEVRVFLADGVPEQAVLARRVGKATGPVDYDPHSHLTRTNTFPASGFFAPQPGLGADQYANGWRASDFPGGAYFAKDRLIAEDFESHYDEGIITVRIPSDVYDTTFRQHERPYLDIPGTTELLIPESKLAYLSTFPRTWERP